MRIEKVAILDEVVSRVKDSDYCFIINHGGVDVAKFSKLRADLRKLDSRLLVVNLPREGRQGEGLERRGQRDVRGSDGRRHRQG